jgi:hypothetical protein
MGEQRKDQRPTLKVLPGGGQREARALDRLLGRRHSWLLKLGALCGVLAAITFLLIPAFSRRAPRLTAEEVAAAMAASDGLGPLVTGLVEVLDLDARQALALKQTLERFDERARGPRQEREAALAVLRGAAAGSGAEAPAVDLALVQRRQAQARLEALDAELVEAVSAGLSPSQKARAAIVLGHYLQRGGAEGHVHPVQGGDGQAGQDARPAKAAPAPRTAPAAPP